MKRMVLPPLFILLASFCLASCVSVGDVNDGFRRIDRMWQADYQKSEDLFRYRVVEAPYPVVYSLAKKAVIQLGVPIVTDSIDKGVIYVECDAPKPLTTDEWRKVAESEAQRVRETGGWMFSMTSDPKGYVVKAWVRVSPLAEKTLVLLDYELDMPQYKRMGFSPSKVAPPMAVQIASMKFWGRLGELLETENLPKPRLKAETEKEQPQSTPETVSPESTKKEIRMAEQQTFKWPTWKKLDALLISNPSKTTLESDRLFLKISKSIWMVISEKTSSGRGTDSASLGSAVAISRHLLITNCHVVMDSRTIRLVQGDSSITATVIAADEKTDRCVLSADADLVDFVSGTRDFGDLRVGEKVYTIGSPSGLERTLGDGIISGLRTTKSMRFIQTTAPISPGSSGGGLFDRSGNLIGITTFLFKEGQNLNFAIAASDYWKN
jgi:S1-C subfamily serine protease